MSGVWDEMRAESMAEGMAQGMAQGMAKGAEQAQEGFAVRMIKAGELTLQKIAEYSGLSLRRIKTLARTMA